MIESTGGSGAIGFNFIQEEWIPSRSKCPCTSGHHPPTAVHTYLHIHVIMPLCARTGWLSIWEPTPPRTHVKCADLAVHEHFPKQGPTRLSKWKRARELKSLFLLRPCGCLCRASSSSWEQQGDGRINSPREIHSFGRFVQIPHHAATILVPCCHPAAVRNSTDNCFSLRYYLGGSWWDSAVRDAFLMIG